MSKLYVGSEVGQLRRVLLNRPERALTHLTPSNCHELLFDDVLAVEAAGEEHDAFARTLREQDVEVLLLHDLLVETLAVPEAKQWLLNTQISDFRYGPTFARDLRQYLLEMDDEHLATILLGGLAYSELPIQSSSMLPKMKRPLDFVIEPLPNHLFTRDTSCWVYGGVSLNPMMILRASAKQTIYALSIAGTRSLQAKTSLNILVMMICITTTQTLKAVTYW